MNKLIVFSDPPSSEELPGIIFKEIDNSNSRVVLVLVEESSRVKMEELKKMVQKRSFSVKLISLGEYQDNMINEKFNKKYLLKDNFSIYDQLRNFFIEERVAPCF